MLMTINRCIDYTKASKGLKLVPQNITLELWDSIQLPLQCLENLQARVEIKMHPIPSSICTHIITDKQWLQENLLCLLSNAVKYSSEGEVNITVSLEDRMTHDIGVEQVLVLDDGLLSVQDPTSMKPVPPRNKSLSQSGLSRHQSFSSNVVIEKVALAPLIPSMRTYLRFEVEDTGIGMTEEQMASLFNPFKQSQRLAGGTGLGLYSLAKRLEALHGTYGVMKRRDGRQGSLFWMSVPYKPDMMLANHMNIQSEKCQSFVHCTEPAVLPQQHNRNDINRSVSVSADCLSILVVDDSPAIVKMVGLMLRHLGHKISTAENGAIAVNMIDGEDVPLDVVLMDLQMPVMDGLEATTRIRQRDEQSRKHRVIVGMSANSDHDTTQSAFDAGVDAFLPKPFDLDSIRAVLDSVPKRKHGIV
jgi:CheY-like chemotaxis protein